ncbi:MAG: AAA family ATPase [Dehalococcoidia bacterium]
MSSEESIGDEVNPPPIDRKNLRLTHISLINWRNFTKLDAALQQMMFLVGPNASGKSNFLDSFRFLSEMVSVGGGFEAAVAKRGGVSMIRSLAARKNPAVSLTVSLGTEEAQDEWRYELVFKQDNQRRPRIERERVWFRSELKLDRPDHDDLQDPERLRQTGLEQVIFNKDFRVIADVLSTVRYMHIVPQLVREPDRSVGRANDPFGGDFLEQIARTPKQTRESRLRRIVSALRVAVPQLQELELQADSRGVPHLRGKYQHWRPHGAWQNEEHFSDGTLRLMGLLWAVTESSGPLLLEEPELSLHPEVVRHIPQMFRRVQRRAGRQIVVSSHSPDLLNDPGIGNDEVILLTTSPEGTSAELLADNAEAVAMRSAGIELSEILRGLTAPERADQLTLFAS